MSAVGTHYAGGAAAGLAVAQAAVWAGVTPAAAVGMVVVSVATSGGLLSPDVDNGKWWKRLDKWLPDERFGVGGPLQHRGVTHWWGTTLTLGMMWALAMALAPAPLGQAWWIGAGQTIGWCSHLALDFIYGRRVVARLPSGALVTIVRAGIPMAPWWGHCGGIWTSSGPGSKATGAVLGLVAAGQSILLIGAMS